MPEKHHSDRLPRMSRKKAAPRKLGKKKSAASKKQIRRKKSIRRKTPIRPRAASESSSAQIRQGVSTETSRQPEKDPDMGDDTVEYGGES